MEFKEYYDKLIEGINHSTGILIPYDNYPTIKPDTLYKKVCDGLLWLRDYLDVEEAKKYHLLKSLIEIKRQRQGVELRVMTHLVDGVYREADLVPVKHETTAWIDTTKNWQTSLKSLLKQPDLTMPLQIVSQLDLSAEEIAEAKQILLSHGVPAAEMWVESSNIRFFHPSIEE